MKNTSQNGSKHHLRILSKKTSFGCSYCSLHEAYESLHDWVMFSANVGKYSIHEAYWLRANQTEM